jgi:hypothetical protein
MQQLLLLVAMRPERATQSMNMFVSSILGNGQKQKKTLYPTDLTKVARTVRADQIPVVLFKENPELPVNKLQQFTTKAGVSICSSPPHPFMHALPLPLLQHSAHYPHLHYIIVM